MHKFFIFCIFSRVWVYQSAIQTTENELRKRCDMGWILTGRGGRCSWSVAKKTGSMYLCRRWSLWTFAATLLAWHSICHTSQPVLFRATDANPQPAFFQSHQRLEKCNIPSVRWKSCAFYKVVWWHFSGVVGKGITVCFFSEITKIIWSTCRSYVWMILWKKWLFWISQGKVVRVYKWGGQVYKLLMSNFLRI